MKILSRLLRVVSSINYRLMHLPLLEKLGIKTKILMAVIVPLIAIAVFTAITLFSISKNNYLADISTNVDNVRIYSLDSRRHEKDFLLRKKSKYVKKHKESVEQMKATFATLVEHSWTEEERLVVKDLESSIGFYEEHFMEVVAGWEEKGTSSKKGIRGSFKKSTDELEAAIIENDQLKALENQFLKCKLRQNEYQFRASARVLKKFEEDVETLFVLIKASTAADLLPLAENYFNQFVKITVIDKKIAASLSSVKTEVRLLERSLGSLQATVTEEAIAFSKKISLVLMVVAAIVITLCLMFGLFLATVIRRQIATLAKAMMTLTEGNLEIDIPYSQRKDELGDMSRAMEIFKQNANRIKEMEIEGSVRKKQETAERKKLMIEIANDFEINVEEAINALSSASQDMQLTAQSMATLSKKTCAQAKSVSETSKQSSENITTVATATDELSSSISEITHQVSQSSEIANNAVRESKIADSKVLELSESVQKIGQVVKMIDDIAKKTNLLALNATIEAARAGESGKGFSVVADEVKTLANQTSLATKDIDAQIKEIAEAAEAAAESIRIIGSIIEQNNEVAASIAGAVEEQEATTAEIAQNVELASIGSSKVSSNMDEMASAAAETGEASSSVLRVASDFGTNASRLSDEVHQFIDKIRKDNKNNNVSGETST